MEEDTRQRTVNWDDPSKLAEIASRLSGLEYLRGMVNGTIDHPPISLLVDFRLVEVAEGLAVFEITPAEYHLNPFGAVHGGVTAGVLDAATGCAVHSTLPAGAGYTSVEIKVNYIRPIMQASGAVRCEGKVVHTGQRLAIAEGRITDKEGKLYAFGVSTCMVFR